MNSTNSTSLKACERINFWFADGVYYVARSAIVLMLDIPLKTIPDAHLPGPARFGSKSAVLLPKMDKSCRIYGTRYMSGIAAELPNLLREVERVGDHYDAHLRGWRDAVSGQPMAAVRILNLVGYCASRLASALFWKQGYLGWGCMEVSRGTYFDIRALVYPSLLTCFTPPSPHFDSKTFECEWPGLFVCAFNIF